MLRSFYVALTGLNASKDWLDITSNNVANANTIGFKKSRPIFQDLVLQNIFSYNHYSQTVNKITFGGGVFMPTTLVDFSQGSLKFTGSATDLAIDGDGFFILSNYNGARYYSRDGEFKLAQTTDENGKAVTALVHSSGLYLLADKIDPTTLQPTGKLEKVTLPVELPPEATKQIYATDGSNLDPRGNAIGIDFNPSDATTYNVVYTVQIYDKAGNSYDVGIFFKKLNPLLKDSSGILHHTYIVEDGAGNTYFTFLDDNNNYIKAKATSLGSAPTSESNMKLITTNVKVYNGTKDLDVNAVYWYKDSGGNIHIYAKDSKGNWYELSADTNYPTVTPAQNTPAEVENTWQTFVLFKDPNSRKWIDILGNQDQAKDGNTTLKENNFTYDIVYFNSDGTLGVDCSGNKEITIDLKNHLPASLKNALALKKVNLEGLTQYPIDFALGFQQDGYPPGLLQSVSIGEDGTITGIYSNGQTLPLYRLKLAYFTANQELINKGSNIFSAPSTINPVEQFAGVRSKIRAGSLELSNVDVAEELINMITAEKAYQANAKVVQTGQTILDTTINLKR